MLARLLIFAMLSGAIAVFAALWLGFPVWMLLLAYPLAGATALLLGGACVAVSGSLPSASARFDSVQPETLPIRARR